MSKNCMSICALYIKIVFFFPHFYKQTVCTFGSNVVFTVNTCLIFLFVCFLLFFWGKGNVLPFNLCITNHFPHFLTHRNWVTACRLRDQPECLQVRKQGFKYRLFPWITQYSIHSSKCFSLWLMIAYLFVSPLDHLFFLQLSVFCSTLQIWNVFKCFITMHEN